MNRTRGKPTRCIGYVDLRMFEDLLISIQSVKREMSWVRSGYCCRCGDCCIGDPYPDKDDPACTHLMRVHKPERPGRCPLLQFHIGAPQGDTSCVGHIGMVPEGSEDPYYMSGCNVWPTVPDHIKDYPRCTYSFEWRDD